MGKKQFTILRGFFFVYLNLWLDKGRTEWLSNFTVGEAPRMTGSASSENASKPARVPPVSGGSREESPSEPPYTGQEEEEEEGEGWDDEDWGDIDVSILPNPF